MTSTSYPSAASHFETLGIHAGHIVRRGLDASGRRVLVAVAPDDEASDRAVERLRWNLAISRELSGDHFVRSLEVGEHEGRLALFMEDLGGALLSSGAVQHEELSVKLQLAIDLAAALGAFHAAGLIHRDLKPSCVLVDRDAGRARLGGFGLAVRLPRHQPPAVADGLLVGTPAYMAPEQSGWMNRSVDSRSDLYAYGVILYELLVGELPFVAANIGEWIHCHVARQPVAPHLRARCIPEALSLLVLRLLAKSADARYQTASGVAADLCRCLAELEATGTIAPFELGHHDVASRLVVPEKLYGRAGELATLLGAQRRTAERGRPELAIISGYSGVGKSSLVNELQQQLAAPGARLVSGKFDQYRRDIPYSTLAQVFGTLVGSLLAESEESLGRWRTAILEALAPNGRIVSDLIPELALIIGSTSPVALAPQEAKFVAQTVLRRFLGVFSRAEHPLVVFLDDLQWLDVATLEFLEHLLATEDAGHLLLVVAYRDNEVGPGHPLRQRLEKLRAAWGGAREIVLEPLRLEHVTELVADTVRQTATAVGRLAGVVHEKTGGNPFFAVQFLSAIHEDGLLTFDAGAGRWKWDTASILAQPHTDNVVDLMIDKITRLPAATGNVLGHLACLGTSASPLLLSAVDAKDEEVVRAALLDAVRGGLVTLADGDLFAFAHDRVQEAAYLLVPERERPAVHRRLGRLLMLRTAPETRAEMAFEIVSQLNRGSSLITAADERLELARLNATAGKRARAGSAYDAALAYFTAAQALLPDDGWYAEQELAFEIALLRAECEFVTGAPDQAEERLAALTPHAITLTQSSAIASLQVTVFGSRGRYERSLEVGLDFLRRAGIDWSLHPSDEVVADELARVFEQLGSRPIASFVDMPTMSDPDRVATVEVLCQILTPALFIDQTLYGLIVARAVNLSLEHGAGDGAALAFAVLGLILTTSLQQFETGRELGELAMALLEQRGFGRFRPKVFVVLAHLLQFTRDFSDARPLGQRGYDAGLETGDLTYAAYAFILTTMSDLATGAALAEVESRLLEGLAFSQRSVPLMIFPFLDQLNLVRRLRGLPLELLDYPDEKSIVRHLDSDVAFATVACWGYIRRAQAHVIFGDTPLAVAAVEKAKALVWTAPIYFELAEYHFFAAIAHARAHDTAAQSELAAHRHALAEHHAYLAMRANQCPQTFDGRELLVRAEVARVEARHWDAQLLYEQAIAAARRSKWPPIEALASEVAARFYERTGFATTAQAYLRLARHAYLQWGATEKARSLEEAARETPARPQQAPHSTIQAAVEQLDLATVLKVSGAVTGEIVQEKLVRQLMTIAVEHAGAERALLVLTIDSGAAQSFRVHAEALIGASGIDVLARDGEATQQELPISLLRFVAHTRESMVLDDAVAHPTFALDPYIQARAARSILCLPLARHGVLTGALYLENRFISGVFTPARLSVLRLLVSQAAISLEHARVYEQLRQALEAINRSEEQLRTTIDAIPSMVWFNRADGGNEFQSAAWREYTGLNENESTGNSWISAVHPEDIAHVVDVWGGLIREGIAGDVEARVRRFDGVYRWFLFRAKPMRDGDGTIIKWYGITTDIEESKKSQAALAVLQSKMANVSRVATVGELTASIAHEINQPLAGISMNASAGLRWLGHSPPRVAEARRALELVARDGKRMNEVIQRVRSLFTKGEGERSKVDINQMVREMIDFTSVEARNHSVTVRTKLAEPSPTALGDRVQLQQVVVNLVANAIHATSTIQGRRRELMVSTSVDDANVRVAVEDSGIGIEAADAERLFEAFHTTKATGMGLGLSISRSIIQAHAGKIWAERNDRYGATFQFTLPRDREVSAS